MYIVSELTGVIAEMLLAYIYFNGFFTKRPYPWWAMGSAYFISGIILALLSFVPNASFIRLAASDGHPRPLHQYRGGGKARARAVHLHGGGLLRGRTVLP